MDKPEGIIRWNLKKGMPMVHGKRIGIVQYDCDDSTDVILLEYGDNSRASIQNDDIDVIWPEKSASFGWDTYLRNVDSCPLCKSSSKSSEVIFQVNQLGWSIPVVRCSSCGLVFKSVVPNNTLLSEIYSSGYVHFSANSEDLDLTVFLSRVQRMGHPKPGKKIHLDYGCGNGGLVQCARSLGWESYGCDPYLPEQLPPNIESSNLFQIVGGRDSRLLKEVGKYNVVTMWAVAEHLTNVGETFETIAALLAEDGQLIVNWPFGESLLATRNGSEWSMGLLLEHLSFASFECVQWIGSEFSLEIESIRIAGVPFPLGVSNLSEFEAQGLRESPRLYPSIAEKGVEKFESVSAFIGPHRSSFFSNLLVKLGGRLRSSGGVGPLAYVVRQAIHHLRLGDHLEIRFRKKVSK